MTMPFGHVLVLSGYEPIYASRSGVNPGSILVYQKDTGLYIGTKDWGGPYQGSWEPAMKKKK